MSRRCEISTHEIVPNSQGGVRCKTCAVERSKKRYDSLRATGLTYQEIRAGVEDEKEYYPWQHYDFGGH